MKKAIHVATAMAAVLCLTAMAGAQTAPQLINYQGYLTDSAGNPLATAEYKLTFNIYDSATGTTAAWGPQAFTGVPVVKGHFNVILGPKDDNGKDIETAFASDKAYLEITVNDVASPILPRQQILSVPYAMRAEHAAKADAADKATQADQAAQAAQVTNLTNFTHIRLDTANGYGSSSGNKIRRYANVRENINNGGVFEYVDDPVEGTRFEIKKKCIVWCIMWGTSDANGFDFGLTLNKYLLDSQYPHYLNFPAENILASAGGLEYVTAGRQYTVSWTGVLNQGDILRPQTSGYQNVIRAHREGLSILAYPVE